jgi:hypothetical protein
MRVLTAIMVGLVGIGGCAQSAEPRGGGDTLPATVLRAESHCRSPSSEPVVLWVDDPRRLQKIYADPARIPPPAPPAVDFTRDGVIFIGMGQQPTAGYGLDLAPGGVRLQGVVLQVGVNWRTPPPGVMVPQVITQPCLVLRVPRVSFQRLEVVDQTGRVRASVRR